MKLIQIASDAHFLENKSPSAAAPELRLIGKCGSNELFPYKRHTALHMPRMCLLVSITSINSVNVHQFIIFAFISGAINCDQFSSFRPDGDQLD